MRHPLQEAQHPRNQAQQQQRLQSMLRRQPVHQVEAQLQHQRVIHRRTLEIPPVRQHLLRQLALQDGRGRALPGRRLAVGGQTGPGQQQRPAVLQQMVARMVTLQMAINVARLLAQAGGQIRLR